MCFIWVRMIIVGDRMDGEVRVIGWFVGKGQGKGGESEEMRSV